MSDSHTAEHQDDDLLLEGTLAEHSLEELLEMIGISRQCMEIVVSDGPTQRGALLVKSGQLLSATTADLEGLPAFHAIRARPGDRFALFQRPTVRWPAVTLGPLTQALAAPPPATDSKLVMQGMLGPVTLAELIETASLSRQQLEIAIANSAGRLGSIVVRSSYLLRASERGGSEGIEAFHRLRRVSGEHFLVLRQPADLSLVPIATTRELLRDDSGGGDSDTPPSLVMKGNLSEISIRDVLGAFSLSRQLIELILSDSSGVRGTILVKGGQLLSARSMAHGSQGQPAFFALLCDPGTEVSAHAREQSVRDARPIGSLSALLAEASRPTAAAAPVRAPLMQGNFSTMSFQALMMMISRGRQVMEVVFLRGDEQVGNLVLTAGQLLSARTGSLSGAAAFHALQSDPGASFQVYRIAPDEQASEPISSLQALASKPAPVPAPLRREIVLQRRLDDGGVSDIFQIVGISRMHLELEFTHSSEHAGTMTVKAGQVLTARCGSLRGPDAVHELLALSRAEVVVYQTPAPDPLPRQQGSLADFLKTHNLPVPAAAPPPVAPEPDPALTAAVAQLEALRAQLQAQSTLIEQLNQQATQPPAPTPPPTPAPAPSPSPEMLVLLQSLQQPAQSERMLMWLVGSSQVVMLVMLGVLMMRLLG